MTIGVDISQWQATWPNGSWDFAFCRATHDVSGVDHLFAKHFADAASKVPLRGAYHFARPNGSSAAAQSALFASECLAHGFRKGADLWALDLEANALHPGADNAAWVAAFMRQTSDVLGGRGFLYVGWPFAVSAFGGAPAAERELRRYNWWLPAYGPNDGKQHPYNAPFVPVLHQYTSRGGPGGSGLDLNAVTDAGVWQRIVGSAPPHTQPPAQPPNPVVQRPPVDRGDNVHTTDIANVPTDDHGNGWIDVRGISTADLLGVVVFGGTNPKQDGYDAVPTARVVSGSDPARIVITRGVPKGTYTLRVAHA